MAIIYSYPAESSPQPTDLILGTSTATVDGKQTNVTRTYTMQTITDYIKTLGGIGVESITFSAPLTGGTITQTGTVGIPQAGAASDGYLSQGDWTVFNNKLGGVSGVVDKIPVYTGAVTLGNSSLTEPTGGTTVTVGKTFAPAADATHDLGVTGTARWRNMFLSGTANAVDFSGTNITITGTLSTGTGTPSAGTDGYILQSKGALPPEWVDLSSAYDTYDVNVTTQGSDVDLNLTSTSGTDNSKVQITAGGGIGLTANSSGQMTIDVIAPFTGSVTDVTSTNTNILTVANSTTTPALTPVMGSVASANTGLVTGGDVNTAIQSALTGLVEFKGGFDGSTGKVAGTANFLDNRGTEIAAAIGDYYVVTVAGTFYGEAVEIGDSLICQTAYSSGNGSLSDWVTVQSNIGVATTTTTGIASFPTGNDGLDITAGGAVTAQVFSGANLTGGYVPDASSFSGDEFLSRDGTFKTGPVSGVSEIIAGNGLSGGTITTSGTIAPDYTSLNNIIHSAPSGSGLSGTDTFIVSQGNNVIEDTLTNLKAFTNAGTGTVTTTGTPTANTLAVFSSSSAITDSMLAQNAGATLLTNTGSFTTTSITDSLGSTGTANQVLTATASGGSIEWGAAAASYTKWVLTGQSGTQDIEDNNTVLVTSGNTAITTAVTATDTLTITSTAYGGGATIGHVPPLGTASTFLRGDGQWAAAGGGSRKVDTGTGDNITVDFTMTQAFTSVDYVDVYISGVYQQKSTYNQPNGTGTTLLRFTTAPPVTASNGIDFVINY